LKTALFIDDDVIFNEIHKALAEKTALAKHVFTCNSAASGLVLLKELANENTPPLPEAVFLDLMMPVMSGFDFLDELEKLPPSINEKIKVVVVSSSLHEKDMERVLGYKSVVEFISKPLNANKINYVVEKLKITRP
jgi:CheY-like chemotaxis protein